MCEKSATESTHVDVEGVLLDALADEAVAAAANARLQVVLPAVTGIFNQRGRCYGQHFRRFSPILVKKKLHFSSRETCLSEKTATF
jgi:hypothetical protein